MTNKTFIPAFKANVGDWEYYIGIMKYAEVARQVDFAHQLGGNTDLSTMIQRGISARTQDIREYLLKSSHRFLGALIVAVWALDGQHRLRAIKDAIKVDPDLGKEDICIIMVAHYDTVDGKLRTRRLFTNINRNAKPTTGAENIVLDEDDGPAIITRRLLTDHEFLKRDGVVRVFTRIGEEGDLRLAAGNVPQGDKRAFTTIVNLYEMVRDVCFGLDASMRNRSARPTDDVLEASYSIIAKRLDEMIEHAGDLQSKLQPGVSARDLRAPKGRESSGHPFMRPVIQKAVFRVAMQIAGQKVLDWDTLLDRISALPWTIGEPPWVAVFNPQNGKMITAKENVGLLDDLLYVHLAAPSKQSIVRARKQFRDIRGFSYPITDDHLRANLTPHTEHPEPTSLVPDQTVPDTEPERVES